MRWHENEPPRWTFFGKTTQHTRFIHSCYKNKKLYSHSNEESSLERNAPWNSSKRRHGEVSGCRKGQNIQNSFDEKHYIRIPDACGENAFLPERRVRTNGSKLESRAKCNTKRCHKEAKLTCQSTSPGQQHLCSIDTGKKSSIAGSSLRETRMRLAWISFLGFFQITLTYVTCFLSELSWKGCPGRN